jgi:HD superfamily phosphodiesterase
MVKYFTDIFFTVTKQPYIEKLFKLKDMMRTSKGKSLALERHQFMELFVSKVNEEYNLLDE